MRVSGNYRLVQYGHEYKKDRKFVPISDFYKGGIYYSEDGFMSVIIRFAAEPKLEDTVSYSGSYRVEGNRIIHDVTMSARPSYEGQSLERVFRIEGDELVLEFENTEESIKFARWKRA